MTSTLKKFRVPITILSIFLCSSLAAWLATRNSFFFFDLPYIGLSVSTGIVIGILTRKKNNGAGRRATQLLVGLYFLFFLNLFMKVNMQLEGFFFQVIAGFFTGAFIHYSIAKLFGPAVFSRGFCGYACWTAMVLDFLPWKKPSGRIKGFGAFRYLHFFLSLAIVAALIFIFKYDPKTGRMESIYWFTAGNLFYYALGITLASTLRDNRAFCKYACPLPVFMKVTSRFSLFKIKVNNDSCIRCGLCEKICPMDIRILEYAKENKRVLSTECILCSECSSACPKSSISVTCGFDAGTQEYLNFKK
jgi:ferredoxin-type protein NapH